jgi:hypothetical protein
MVVDRESIGEGRVQLRVLHEVGQAEGHCAAG